MQKRVRAVETQKLRRIKQRTRVAEQEGMSTGLMYIRLALLWITMISLDLLVGFRFELLWPSWVFLRGIIEALHRSGNPAVLPSQHDQPMSTLFICVTATSDLICWLFIPVRWLIFFATTYVWIHLVLYSNGGFMRTVSSVYSERTQGIPVVIACTFFLSIEIFLRYRCDSLSFLKEAPILSTVFYDATCETVQGIAPILAKVLNEFFGAHCIGYPLVLISTGLRNCYREWRQRRKQDEVAKKNEALYRCLVEALPADYDGPKQYKLEADSIEYELSASPDVPMLMSSSMTGSLASASTRKQSLRQSNGITKKDKKRREKEQQRTPPDARSLKTAEGQRDSAGMGDRIGDSAELKNRGSGSKNGSGDRAWHTDSPDNFRRSRTDSRRSIDTMRTSGGPLQAMFMAFSWMIGRLLEPAQCDEDAASSYNDDEDDMDDDSHSSLGDDEKKSIIRSGSESMKQRSSSSLHSRKSQQLQLQQALPQLTPQQQKSRIATVQPTVSTAKMDDKPRANGTIITANSLANGHVLTGDHKRDDSVDKKTNGSVGHGRETSGENNNDMAAYTVELNRLRLEIRELKTSENDLRLKLSVAESELSRALSESIQLRSQVEQLQARCCSIDKNHEQKKAALSVLENKCAELQRLKNEAEKELQAERRARADDQHKNKNRAEISREQREKEARMEVETDRLRTECSIKDEVLMTMQRELNALREYKEKFDSEAMALELRILREKTVHLETSLAAENKLKQELFRALGEAKQENIKLQVPVDSIRTSTSPPLPSPKTATPPPSSRVPDQKATTVTALTGTSMPPPSYENIMPAGYQICNKRPYSFASSPAPSPTGEHHLFDAHPLPGAGSTGSVRPPSLPSAEFPLPPFEKFSSHAITTAGSKTTSPH